MAGISVLPHTTLPVVIGGPPEDSC